MIAQGRYRLQYKRPALIGSGPSCMSNSFSHPESKEHDHSLGLCSHVFYDQHLAKSIILELHSFYFLLGGCEILFVGIAWP